MVGAALSRECMAHECAPTEMSNILMSTYEASFHPDYWSVVDKRIVLFLDCAGK
jgi:hypothetical protein